MRLFTYHSEDGLTYIRLGSDGVGIAIKNIKTHPLIFSERLNYTKYLKIGRWVVTKLKPYKI